MSLTYVNPVELLNLAGLPANSLDAATIKKARRRLLADLELGDETLDYKGQRLDRSACERACMDLEEPERLRVWHRLANMPALNDFLGSGRPDFLLNPVSASSLVADASLVRMVGLRYAEQYDKALLEAFSRRNVERLRQVAAAPALYLSSERQRAHQGVSRMLRDKIQEVRQLTDSFDDDDDENKVLFNLTTSLNSAGWQEMLSGLPAGPFDALISELAMAARNFAIRFFNTFYKPAPALKLLQEANRLPIDQQTKDKIREDLRQIQEIEVRQQAQARIDAVAGRFGQAFDQLLAYQRQAEAGTANMTTIRQWGSGLSALITELNPMTDSDIVTTRDSLALGLRGLSVSIWNKNQSNGETAVVLLTTGLTLRVSAATTAKLNADKQQLSRMINENKQATQQTEQRIRAEANKKSDTGSGCLIALVILVLVILAIAAFSGGSSPSSSITTPTSTGVAAVTPESKAVPSTPDNTPSPTYEPEVSKYSGNQLKNGSSPLNNCFGKGRYSGPSWIEFRNDNNGTDAIVCLARNSDNKVIRNEYIRAGTSFRMSHIPAGSYYLKVFCGRDWNPTRPSACGTKGYFDSKQRFSESREKGDLILITNNGRSYTAGTMTLYTVAGGNTAQQSIDAGEFFRQ